MLSKILIEFGLNEKEAVVYLTLLHLEIASAQEIATHTKINRSSIYVTIDSLIKKGLISISDDKTIRQYVATSPEILLHAAKNEATKRVTILKKIEQALPELKALHKDTKQKPKVRVFEGRNGLISAFEDTLFAHEKLLRITSSPGNLSSIIGDYMPLYLKKRYERAIKMRGIHPNNEFNRMLSEHVSKKLDTPLLVPESKYKVPADLCIYDDKIGYMSAEQGGIAVIIESKQMSEVMKGIFDMAWKEAKRLSKGKKNG